MSMSKELGFDIPEDIVVRILIKLPVKSLVRFSCVSKRWRSIIISDPKFAKSHLQLASQQRTLRRKFLISTYIKPEKPVKTRVPVEAAILLSQFLKLVKTRNPVNEVIATLQSRFQSLLHNFNAASVRNLTFPSEEYSQRALASCNGLVLLCQYRYLRCDYNELSIWNPSTGFLCKIPSPSSKLPRTYVFVNYGFGYVSDIDDYILFVVSPQEPQSAFSSGWVEVHVFSLTANSWKVIYVPYMGYPDVVGGQGTLSNGALHWVNYPSIRAFDLTVKEFRQVPLPFSVKSDRQLKTLSHFGGCLCLQSGDCYSGHCDIWAMTEYGVPESWVKLFQINRHDLRHLFPSCYNWKPCYVMDDGTVVIKLLDTAELIMVEYRKEEKPVCSCRYKLEPVPGYFDVIEYDETLISVA